MSKCLKENKSLSLIFVTIHACIVTVNRGVILENFNQDYCPVHYVTTMKQLKKGPTVIYRLPQKNALFNMTIKVLKQLNKTGL